MPILLAALASGLIALADGFEFVSYRPPPGWTVVNVDGARRYVLNEAAGAGIISLLPSRPVTGSTAAIFTDVWQTEASKVLPGPPPAPTTQRAGEVTLLVGAKQVPSQGTTVRVVVALAVWKNRALGIVAMGTGATRQAEIDTFFQSLEVEPDAPAATASSAEPATTTGASGDLGFDVPPGYARQQNASGSRPIIGPNRPTGIGFESTTSGSSAGGGAPPRCWIPPRIHHWWCRTTNTKVRTAGYRLAGSPGRTVISSPTVIVIRSAPNSTRPA
jgi:hypothetical protein